MSLRPRWDECSARRVAARMQAKRRKGIRRSPPRVVKTVIPFKKRTRFRLLVRSLARSPRPHSSLSLKMLWDFDFYRWQTRDGIWHIWTAARRWLDLICQSTKTPDTAMQDCSSLEPRPARNPTRIFAGMNYDSGWMGLNVWYELPLHWFSTRLLRRIQNTFLWVLQFI